MKKKGFTLIEVMISLSLAAILFTLIFRSYISITQITTRLENEKKLDAEITFVTETVQNIADVYQIDYSKYGSSLIASQGRTDTLYLTGAGSTGAQLFFSGNNIRWINNATGTMLISSGTALLSAGKFKIIPFSQLSATGIAFLDVQHPGFRLMATMQLTRYNPKERIRNVQASMQQFYNLQRVE